MPEQFDSGSLAGRSGETESLPPSRRSVLRGAGAAGAAGLAVTALGGLAMPAASAAVKAHSSSAHEAAEHAAEESIVVHVRDASSGHIDIFHGTTAISVRDRDLAARIVRASR
jgi:hypothetical protein